MKRLCIYHSSDLDGHCSGAIVRHRYPDVELLGWNYGQPVPWEQIKESDEVILVDLSFPKEDMIRLLKEMGSRFIWIDHHKTAIEDMGKMFFNYCCGLRTAEQAACELTWQYFFPKDMPRAVWLLGRWDCWAWQSLDERDEIEAFQFGMRNCETRPDIAIDFWNDLLRNDRSCDIPDVINDGNVIVSYRDQQNARIAKCAFEVDMLGDRFLALNAGSGSNLFDSVWSDHPDCVAMLSFVWVGDKWRVTIYSDRGFDCGDFCKWFRGGGHAGAAGFVCDELPFSLK